MTKHYEPDLNRFIEAMQHKQPDGFHCGPDGCKPLFNYEIPSDKEPFEKSDFIINFVDGRIMIMHDTYQAAYILSRNDNICNIDELTIVSASVITGMLVREAKQAKRNRK